jgi:hypothetical protein
VSHFVLWEIQTSLQVLPCCASAVAANHTWMAILAVQVTSLTPRPSSLLFRRQQQIFTQTLLRGVEQRRITLGSMALHENPHTTPIAAPVLVYLNHDSKVNKDNAASDNRTSTYATPVLMDPQLHLGLHVYSRLAGRGGAPLTEAEIDSGAW